MSWHYKKVLSLFLVFMLGIGSFQVAIAASSPLLVQTDDSCPMLQTMGDSGQEKTQNNDCVDFSCHDYACASSAVATPADFLMTSLTGLPEKITGIENKIASNFPYLLFRPPRN